MLLRALLVLWPALLAAGVAYTAFHLLARAERVPRPVLATAAALLAVPWLACLAYYTHLLDGPLYYEWRSWPATDFAAGGVGALVAVLVAGRGAGRPDRREEDGGGGRARRRRGIWRGAGHTAFLVVLAFAKPALGLLDPDTLRDEWVDGVCIQTSAASCGACTTATVLRSLGEDVTEREVAMAAATSRTGTLNWLLARTVRERGYEARFTAPAAPWDAAPPAILGVTTGGVGHFVVLLSVEGDRMVVGEPLSGREELTRAEFDARYRFDRFALEVRRAGREGEESGPPATE